MAETDAPVRVSLDGMKDVVAAVSSLELALRQVDYKPGPYRAGQRRFEMLCIDLFKAMCRNDPVLNVARTLVIGVEGGEIARRHIRTFAADRFPDLSEVNRAFAVGLAMGFMTEFLPREGA